MRDLHGNNGRLAVFLCGPCCYSHPLVLFAFAIFALKPTVLWLACACSASSLPVSIACPANAVVSQMLPKTAGVGAARARAHDCHELSIAAMAAQPRLAIATAVAGGRFNALGS